MLHDVFHVCRHVYSFADLVEHTADSAGMSELAVHSGKTHCSLEELLGKKQLVAVLVYTADSANELHDQETIVQIAELAHPFIYFL